MRNELQNMRDNKIKLSAIGNVEKLPDNVKKQLDEVIEATATNDES